MKNTALKMLMIDIKEISEHIKLAISLFQIEKAERLVAKRMQLIQALEEFARNSEIKPSDKVVEILNSVVIEIDALEETQAANRSDFVNRRTAMRTYGALAA